MTVPAIDFTTLSLQDALDLAILVEDEALERYQELADQMDLHHTPEAAGFFRFMAQNEQKHGAELQERRRVLFGDAPRAVTRAQLFDVEAPDYDEARAFMTPRQAMEVAMNSETKAHAYFVAALASLRDPDVKRLFEELRDEEVHHQDLVRRELDKLPPDDTLGADAFADEPVAQ